MLAAAHPASRKARAKLYPFYGRHRKSHMTDERFHRIKKGLAEADGHVGYPAFHDTSDGIFVFDGSFNGRFNIP